MGVLVRKEIMRNSRVIRGFIKIYLHETRAFQRIRDSAWEGFLREINS